ncbi:MAG: hypothetical protein RI842_08865 [Schleiferiaceae bacterium]|nr:hypothetical protein [Schleiferiaceae bacterium]
MRTCLAAFFVFTAFFCEGQSPTFGPIQKAEKRGFYPQIVGESKEEIYGMDARFRKNILVSSFDKESLRSNYVKVIKLDGQMGVVEDLVDYDFMNDKFVIFRSYYHRKEKRFDLDVHIVGAARGRVIDRFNLLSKRVEKNLDRGFYDITYSPNKDAFVVSSFSYYKSLDKTIEKLIVFDDEFNQLAEKEFRFDGDMDEVSGISAISVDDEGNVYFPAGRDLVILDVTADLEEWREPLALGEMESNAKLTDYTTSFDNQGNLVILGSYYTKDVKDRNENKSKANNEEGDAQVVGLFYQKINTLTKAIIAANISKFDPAFTKSDKSKRDRRKGYDGEIENNLTSYNIFHNEDGSLVAVTESYVKTTYRSAESGGVSGRTKDFKDIYAFKIEADGRLKWAQRINRNQQFFWGFGPLLFVRSSVGWLFSNVPYYGVNFFSHASYEEDGKINFIFNTDESNVGKKRMDLKRLKKVKKAKAINFDIDISSGELSQSSNATLSKPGLKMLTLSAYYSELSEALFYVCLRKKDYCLAKM